MEIVRFGQEHEFFDVVILYLVVVGLATESKRILVHVDAKASSGVGSALKEGAAAHGHQPWRQMQHL